MNFLDTRLNEVHLPSESFLGQLHLVEQEFRGSQGQESVDDSRAGNLGEVVQRFPASRPVSPSCCVRIDVVPELTNSLYVEYLDRHFTSLEKSKV